MSPYDKEDTVEAIQPWLPFLVPILGLQLILTFVALLDLVRRERTRGPKAMWALIILLMATIGPIAYLVLGRQDE